MKKLQICDKFVYLSLDIVYHDVDAGSSDELGIAHISSNIHKGLFRF